MANATSSDVDSLFVFICGILVFFMLTGFGMLEVGGVQAKNSKNILLKNLLIICYSAFAWYFLGFTLAMGPDSKSHFLGWTKVDRVYLAMHDIDRGYDYIQWFFGFARASIAATIVSGALAERTQYRAYFLFSLLLTGWIYPIVAFWVWSPAGWLAIAGTKYDLNNGFLDFGGSGVVHMVGGACALVGCLIVEPRKFLDTDEKGVYVERFAVSGDGTVTVNQPSQTKSNPALSVLGTMFIWIGWFGFNCGAQGYFTGESLEVVSLALVNTILAPAASVIMLTSSLMIIGAPIEVGHCLNAVLGGLVSITACCNIVQPWAALIIGAIGGFVYYGSAKLMLLLKIDDVMNAVPVHYFCGMWGLLATGLFANSELSSNPDHFEGLFYGGGVMFGWQLVGIIIITLWCGFFAGLFFFVMNAVGSLRVGAITEKVGLDNYHIEFGAGPGGQKAPEANPIAEHPWSGTDDEVPVLDLRFHDYDVAEDGSPVTVSHKGQFRCAGDAHMAFGFQLTATPHGQAEQQGHFLCLVEFEAAGSEIELKFEYNMHGIPPENGEGLCAYLLDPSVDGWDSIFNGTGPMGFVGKAGALVGIALDNTGAFSDGECDHVTVRAAQGKGEILKKKHVDGGFMTGADDWRKVLIKFDIEDNTCDVSIDGDKVLDDVEFKNIKIPKKLCVAVCGAAHDQDFMIAVNDVKLVDKDDEGKETNVTITGEETGVPTGCTDYKVDGGKLVASDQEEDWRCAGNTTVKYGFELTQDADDQEGHLLCRVPFTTTGKEIYATLEYVMEPKSAAEGGGQGLCIYLCDPTVVGWDRKFDGSGPLGFVGKLGAIVGVGIDCTGTFCEGEPASVAIKRASDSQLLCQPAAVEGGVVTRTDEYWRKVKVKFDIEDNKCDVSIGGVKVLDDIKFEGVTIPKTVCIGVCAGTADGKNNHICVNKVKLKSTDDD